MKRPVSFFSLGPGDPELLTLKVVKALREADIVVVPSTTDKSRAAEIIREWCDEDRMYRYELPMQKDRTAVRKVYDDICQQVVAWYNEEKYIAIVVEGDVSIYASIHYVLDELKRRDIPVTQQPGKQPRGRHHETIAMCGGAEGFPASAPCRHLSLF